MEYDKTSVSSIYEYSAGLINKCLRDFMDADAQKYSGKGGYAQLVEEIFFKYKPNSNPGPDFSEAGVELKCTGLKSLKDGNLAIKERLVCGMIDYMNVVNEDFDHSHFYTKCRLMLILFYLYIKGADSLDYEFLYRVLWELPEKDLLIIRHDYNVIVDKIRRGEAHLLSEGDTVYLAACRKGQKDSALRAQPNTDILAKGRAFSLKPSYMRTILDFVISTGENHATNYQFATNNTAVTLQELQQDSFEDVLLKRFSPYKGLNIVDISARQGKQVSTAKHKYAIVANNIVSISGDDINESEEFRKSGITMKTVRVQRNGTIKESMSFENINYCEVYDCEDWVDSRLYEIFTSRFLFVIYRETDGEITLPNGKVESEYKLDKVFFWTMPESDLVDAEIYWNDIKKKVMDNKIGLDYFFHIKDNKKFHVRPKAQKKTTNFFTAINPHGGNCQRLCYWFNASFVKSIIESN